MRPLIAAAVVMSLTLTGSAATAAGSTLHLLPTGRFLAGRASLAARSPGWPRIWRATVTWWPRSATGWKRWLLVTGAEHPSFTDIGLLADQLGLDYGADVPGSRVSPITRAYVRAFFDEHLRNQPQPLLERPSARYPEVKFCTSAPNSCC